MKNRNGVNNSFYGRKHKKESLLKAVETRRKNGSYVAWNRGIKLPYQVWNKGMGSKTTESKRIRLSKEYIEWREKVFKRDNYTCQDCGKRGGELHPHHIKEFSKFPELRFEVSNGKTLCPNCHKKTDSYGRKNCPSDG